MSIMKYYRKLLIELVKEGYDNEAKELFEFFSKRKEVDRMRLPELEGRWFKILVSGEEKLVQAEEVYWVKNTRTVRIHYFDEKGRHRVGHVFLPFGSGKKDVSEIIELLKKKSRVYR